MKQILSTIILVEINQFERSATRRCESQQWSDGSQSDEQDLCESPKLYCSFPKIEFKRRSCCPRRTFHDSARERMFPVMHGCFGRIPYVDTIRASTVTVLPEGKKVRDGRLNELILKRLSVKPAVRTRCTYTMYVRDNEQIQNSRTKYSPQCAVAKVGSQNPIK